MRRTTTAAGTVLVATLTLASGVTAPTARPVPGRPPDGYARALVTYAAMSATFRHGDHLTGSSAALESDRRADAWPLSQALAADLAVASTSPAAQRQATVDADIALVEANWVPRAAGRPGGYASTTPAHTGDAGGDQYYDDNEWIALDLVAAYHLHPDPALLARIRAVFDLVASGWAGDATTCRGGVYWVRSGSNRDRNAVTTMNGAILALELQRLTGARAYTRWALRMLTWTRQCLGLPDGLLADHLDADGVEHMKTWSYNQGAFVAAAVLLARTTGDRRFVADAERVATAALDRFGSFRGEPPAFVAIFFRDLALLDRIAPRQRYRDALERYGDDAWGANRDPRTGLFASPGSPPQLIDQAAMVQIYALVAGWPGLSPPAAGFQNH